MEKQPSNSLQNFEDSKSEILKKRLLKSVSASNSPQNNSKTNVVLNTIRAPVSNSMIVSSVSGPQNAVPISHNLVTHSIAPMKIHPNNTPYPLLSTVHVPVQIPGSTSNINVPVQLGTTTSMPLQLTPVSLPLQVSGTTNVPVQLPAGETINVPLQIPTANQNIQLPAMPSMPILQNANQQLGSIYVHMGSNTRQGNLDGSGDMIVTSSSQLQMPDASGQVKMTSSLSQVQMATNPTMVQIPNSSNNSIQLTLPNTCNSGPVQLRGTARTVPHVVYIQTSTGLKPVTSSEVITQASTSGNPPQIIVRRPVTNNSNIIISNVNTKPNIAPKPAPKSSIVIQKPKEKVIVPVTISSGTQGKQAIAYLSSVKKSKQMPENQSILISNNQPNVNANNQKVFLTPMTMPKMQNTKFILPVTLPATMASKGPIINLQIANGQIQNDPQGNSITVMRDTGNMETSDMPPLQPLAKPMNGSDSVNCMVVPQSPKSDKTFTVSIPGSRAEPTGEQGEYTLSIPETNAAMNDDVYTVSIADEEDGHTTEKSFTLAIPEKGKSLLNKNIIDKNDFVTAAVPAPAILRRSYSDNCERKSPMNPNMKRRISLCSENTSNKNYKTLLPPKTNDKTPDHMETSELSDEHRVPSLFCDEKLEEAKVNTGESDSEDKGEAGNGNSTSYNNHFAKFVKRDIQKFKRDSFDSAYEEDPPGLIWNNGIAQLQGSGLQFHTNEFGLIDVIDGSDADMLNPSQKYQTPLKQRIHGREKKPMSPEDMYRCDGCGCHGMAAEFITPNFCSIACQNDVQKIVQRKRDREKIELLKRRNKIRKLLMKKQLSDTDIILDSNEKVSLKHYDSMPTDSLSDVKAEDMIENEKYPWMCGKNGFSWMRYLDVCKAKAAPVKLFKDPFPYNRNYFKVGMRMEGIDPKHPSLFCVVSVAEVQGYRMRLHFDEYPEVFDYWVNADSCDIFPAGWCEKNGRSLRPPPSCGQDFSWPMYLKQARGIAAPKHLFAHVTSSMIKPNGFRIGMKLEAEDRKNDLVCVATIADILDNRLLINFDSWDEMYDFWVEPTSPYIHAVGWAEEHGVSLTPPNFYKDPDAFSWDSYLEETCSLPAPPRAFKTRAPQGFKPGMKLEAVDPRVPFLIRVASIAEVRGHQVLVSFDGWPRELAVWVDDDCPDLHPVGWCLKTQHPLEPPLTPEELEVLGPCGVGGCRGLGSLRGGPHKTHSAASACPYRSQRPPAPRDRLDELDERESHDRVLPRSRRVPAKPKSLHTSTPTSDAQKPRGRPPKHKRVEEVGKNEGSDDDSVSSGGKRWRCRAYDRDGRGRRATPTPAHALAPRIPTGKFVDDLGLNKDPTQWSQEDVASLVTLVAGAAAGSAVRGARLAGTQLLMVSRDELVACLRLRLGPAIKVYSAVRQLRDAYACS